MYHKKTMIVLCACLLLYLEYKIIKLALVCQKWIMLVTVKCYRIFKFTNHTALNMINASVDIFNVYISIYYNAIF